MIKFFKKEKKFKKEESLWLDINIYWELAVCFMFVAVILFFFFGYYLFKQINNEESALKEGDGSEQFDVVKKERIEKVLEYFSARKQKSNQILNSPASVVDPSL